MTRVTTPKLQEAYVCTRCNICKAEKKTSIKFATIYIWEHEGKDYSADFCPPCFDTVRSLIAQIGGTFDEEDAE